MTMRLQTNAIHIEIESGDRSRMEFDDNAGFRGTGWHGLRCPRHMDGRKSQSSPRPQRQGQKQGSRLQGARATRVSGLDRQSSRVLVLPARTCRLLALDPVGSARCLTPTVLFAVVEYDTKGRVRVRSVASNIGAVAVIGAFWGLQGHRYSQVRPAGYGWAYRDHPVGNSDGRALERA